MHRPTSGLARSQQRNNLVDGGARFFAQHGIVVVRDRVADHRERVALQAVDFAHRLRGACEAVGDDSDGRDAEPLCLNRVVQTARRAAASVAGRGEHRVGPPHLREHLGQIGRAHV